MTVNHDEFSTASGRSLYFRNRCARGAQSWIRPEVLPNNFIPGIAINISD
jgi:hypothetical protein